MKCFRLKMPVFLAVFFLWAVTMVGFCSCAHAMPSDSELRAASHSCCPSSQAQSCKNETCLHHNPQAQQAEIRGVVTPSFNVLTESVRMDFLTELVPVRDFAVLPVKTGPPETAAPVYILYQSLLI